MESEKKRPRPCMFCKEIEAPVMVIAEAGFWVECRSCQATGPFCDTEAEALAAWNEPPRYDCNPECPYSGRPW